jgi:broad-specificity NMP kinase
MNYLITGFPGTGKTSIAAELKRRGHNAYDTENMRGYMHTESRVDGGRIQKPSDVPSGWYDTVGAYNWDTVKILTLLDGPNDKFICAKAHNQSEFFDKFDKIFVLTLDFTEVIKRLHNRPGKAIGKTDSELSDIIIMREHFERSLLGCGAIAIDVTKGLHEVTDEILQYTYSQ